MVVAQTNLIGLIETAANVGSTAVIGPFSSTMADVGSEPSTVMVRLLSIVLIFAICRSTDDWNIFATMRRSISVGTGAEPVDAFVSTRISCASPRTSAFSQRFEYSSLAMSATFRCAIFPWYCGALSSALMRSCAARSAARSCAADSIAERSASMRANFSRSSPCPRVSTCCESRPLASIRASSLR